MKAFHSFWSMPNYVRNNGVIGFPDFELLTAILSALKWQEHNGRIKLITDTRGAEFFRGLGLESLWNEMDVSLDQMDAEIDPFLFWAAGKLYALKSMTTPCVMLDTDLIIWEKIDLPEQADVMTAHLEGLSPEVYPDPLKFHLKEGYQYPQEWDFTLPAANTAFLYLKNADFRDYYVDAAIDFFKNVEMDGLNPVTAMCFAEQRVLPMCAAQKKQTLGWLLDLTDAHAQKLATHTWGFKQVLRNSREANEEFCMRCVKRIMTDYPKTGAQYLQNRQLEGYLQAYLNMYENH